MNHSKILEGGKCCTYYAAGLEAENFKQTGNGPFFTVEPDTEFHNITQHAYF